MQLTGDIISSNSYENFLIKNELIANGLNVVLPLAGFSYTPFVKSLYDYDQVNPEKVETYPQEIILDNADTPEEDFYVRVRRNPQSSWSLFSDAGNLYLQKGARAYKVGISQRPDFYNIELNFDGKKEPITNYVHKLGQDVLSVVVNNYCSYHQQEKECHFCELKRTYDTTHLHENPHKNLKQLANAIATALKHDSSIKRIAINGGNYSIDNDLTIKKYIELIKSIKELVTDDIWQRTERWIVAMPPSDFKLLEELKKAGATLILFNMELWKDEIFNYFCPGKALCGKDRMLEAQRLAVEVFGVGNVLSCFIYGLQSLPKDKPYVCHWKHENAILLDCLEKLAENRVIQLINIYHETGRNKIGKIDLDAKYLTDYHIQYGLYIAKSGLIPADKIKNNVLWGSLGSIPNSINNEAVFLALKNKI